VVALLGEMAPCRVNDFGSLFFRARAWGQVSDIEAGKQAAADAITV